MATAPKASAPSAAAPRACAPVAVASAAGLHCSRLDGDELVYNNENPYLPDLLICRPELRVRVLAEVVNAPPGSFETA